MVCKCELFQVNQQKAKIIDVEANLTFQERTVNKLGTNQKQIRIDGHSACILYGGEVNQIISKRCLLPYFKNLFGSFGQHSCMAFGV